jgi:hypothetical protein
VIVNKDLEHSYFQIVWIFSVTNFGLVISPKNAEGEQRERARKRRRGEQGREKKEKGRGRAEREQGRGRRKGEEGERIGSGAYAVVHV